MPYQETFLHQPLDQAIDGGRFEAVNTGEFSLRAGFTYIATGQKGRLPDGQIELGKRAIMR